MKTLDHSISKDYPPVKLHLEDLVDIERVLKGNSAEVQFQTEGYSFDSVDELVSHIRKRELAEMEIQTTKPSGLISFNRFHARLCVGSSELDSAGLFYKLDHILRRTRRQLWFLYSFYSIYVLIIISLTSSAISMFATIPLGTIANATLVSCGFAGSVLAMWFANRRSHHSIISLISRNTQSSFWIRKKDDILLAIISAILGAIVTLLVTKMMN